ncbi:MAG: ribosome biogenesis factor YjgA [Polyangiales bacterium]
MSHDDDSPRLSRDDKRRLRNREVRSSESLAKALLEAKPAVVARLPLSDELAKAIADLRAMVTHKERPRQIRYVHRLLREADTDAIAKALEEAKSGGGAEARFRLLERWRERLLVEGDDAVQDYVEQYPAADRSTLRALVRKAQKAESENEAAHAKRELYARLREAMEADPANDEG